MGFRKLRPSRHKFIKFTLTVDVPSPIYLPDMKARFSLVLTLLLLHLSAFSSQENTPPTTPQKLLLGTWELAKYVHTARSPAGTFLRKDSTLLAPPSPYLVTFHADGTVDRPAAAGGQETYAYPAPTISFYYNGVALPANVTASITELTPAKLQIAYRKEQPGSILYDDFFYVRAATVQ